MRKCLALMTLLIIVFVPNQAQAYIDLGLAGQLFQAVYLIGIAALAFVLSPIFFFWKQISRWIKAHWKRDAKKEK